MCDPWITPDDLRSYKVNCQPVDFGACSDEDLAGAIAEAQSIIELITGKNFCVYDEDKVFDGMGKNKLFFYPVTCDPLVSVDSVTATCGTASEEITGYIVKPHYLELCDSCTTTICCTPCGTCWPAGCDNITISGSWGQELPPLLRKALILLSIKTLNPGALCGQCSTGAIASPRISSIEWPDLKIRFQEESRADFFKGFSTGIPEVDQILDQYICRLGMMIFLP